jgi:hypothetical protein
MDKISRADKPALKLECPDQGLKNYGARQFEYAFVKRKSAPPSGMSASAFVQCVCQNSYCVGSISCVGCVAQLRKMLRTASCTELRTASSSPQLRPASSLVASVLRPVACQLRSCASPNSMLSRMLRNSKRAATAMKVQRTAERLAHIVNLHKRALSELRQSSSELRRSALSNDELSAAFSRTAYPRKASPSVPRPCELRPVASVASRELPQRESPLRKFASVASQSSSIKSVCVKSASVKSELVELASVTVASLRPPKRSLH